MAGSFPDSPRAMLCVCVLVQILKLDDRCLYINMVHFFLCLSEPFKTQPGFCTFRSFCAFPASLFGARIHAVPLKMSFLAHSFWGVCRFGLSRLIRLCRAHTFPTTPRPAPVPGRAYPWPRRSPGPLGATRTCSPGGAWMTSSLSVFQTLGESQASLPPLILLVLCFHSQLTRNLQKIFPLAADQRVAAPDRPSRRHPSPE